MKDFRFPILQDTYQLFCMFFCLLLGLALFLSLPLWEKISNMKNSKHMFLVIEQYISMFFL